MAIKETETKRQFSNTGTGEIDDFIALPSKGNLATWMKPFNSKYLSSPVHSFSFSKSTLNVFYD